MGKLLACALLLDGERVLFLKKMENEKECFALPCLLLDEKENPVIALQEMLLRTLGIDAYVTTVMLNGRHNAGSRRRRQFIGALGFAAKAKNARTTVPVAWVSLADAVRKKLCREAQWLSTAQRN